MNEPPKTLNLSNGEREQLKAILLFSRSMLCLQYGRGEIDVETADTRKNFIDRLMAKMEG